MLCLQSPVVVLWLLEVVTRPPGQLGGLGNRARQGSRNGAKHLAPFAAFSAGTICYIFGSAPTFEGGCGANEQWFRKVLLFPRGDSKEFRTFGPGPPGGLGDGKSSPRSFSGWEDWEGGFDQWITEEIHASRHKAWAGPAVVQQVRRHALLISVVPPEFATRTRQVLARI